MWEGPHCPDNLGVAALPHLAAPTFVADRRLPILFIMSEPVYILGGGRTDFKRNLKKEGKTIRNLITEAERKRSMMRRLILRKFKPPPSVISTPGSLPSNCISVRLFRKSIPN